MCRNTLYLFLLCFLLFTACRQDGQQVNGDEQLSFSESPSVTDFNLSIKHFSLSGTLPAELNYVEDVKISGDPMKGFIAAGVGKEFTFTINEGRVGIDEVKQDLKSLDLFDLVFFDEGDDSFFYEVVLPDGQSAGHHYVRVISEGDRKLIIRTHESIEYSYFTAHLAAKTINSLSIVH